MLTHGTFFSHTDVIPIVSRIIRAAWNSSADYLEHDEIVAALLKDPESAAVIGEKHEHDAAQGGGRSLQGFAGNMVAWFSHWWEKGYYRLADEFERKNIGGKMAFRPARQQREMKRSR